MSVPLVIGCPVYRRAWVLDRWFNAIEAQDPPDGTRYLFALSYDADGRDPDGTAAVIQRRQPNAEIIEVPGTGYEDAERANDARYAYLAMVRNRMLRTVAAIDPGSYLSCDSDILLAPGALDHLRIALITHTDAAGALVDMGTPESGPGYWSWMQLDEDGQPYRPAAQPRFAVVGGQNRLFPVDVIMGAKLMTDRAYRDCRYADHIEGEDVGFAIQMRAMGIQPYLVPQARGEHILRAA